VKKNDKSEMREEAEALITLGKLLKRNRPPEKQREVQVILAGDLSNREKISRIQILDENDISETPHKVPKKKGTHRTYRYFGSQLNHTGKSRAQKNREKIKRSLVPSPIFRYLFRELPRIRAFGVKSGILKPKFLGVRAAPEIRSYLLTFLQPLASDCLNFITQLIGNGWLYLTKKDYNLLVLFQRFCKSVVEFNFLKLNPKDRNCVDNLKNIERQFLALHYREEFIGKIINGTETLIKNNRREIPNLESLPSLIKKITTVGGEEQTFGNILLCLNMVKYRKYVTVKDLMKQDIGEAVDTAFFDCSELTQKEIDRYIEETINRLKLLHQERYEIARLQNYVHVDESDNLILDRLQFFYQNTLHNEEYDFDEDRKQVNSFAVKFVSLFRNVYEPILNGKLELSHLGSVQLFPQAVFKEKFIQLEMVQKKIEALLFKLPHFPRKRYLDLKNTGQGAIMAEAETVGLIDESVEIFADIGRGIDKLLRKDITDSAPLKQDFDPLDSRTLEGENVRFPFSNKIKDVDHPFYDKPLREVLSDLVAVCYLFCSYMQDLTILHMIGKEKSVEDEIGKRLERLQRIADPETYAEVKGLFE
jgi:hypothetical protein